MTMRVTVIVAFEKAREKLRRGSTESAHRGHASKTEAGFVNQGQVNLIDE